MPVVEGSWWPEWQRWIAEHSAPGRVSPPATGAAEEGFAALPELRSRFNPELNMTWFGALTSIIDQITMLSIMSWVPR